MIKNLIPALALLSLSFSTLAGDWTNWRGPNYNGATTATGLPAKAQSHAALHNAGVMAAESGRWKAAEELFGKAIKRQPGTAESWIARGITREKLGKRQLAMQDFSYASTLYDKEGDSQKAEQLKAAAKALKEHITKPEGGNGIGSAVLNGLISTTQALIPLASKLFMPALGL